MKSSLWKLNALCLCLALSPALAEDANTATPGCSTHQSANCATCEPVSGNATTDAAAAGEFTTEIVEFAAESNSPMQQADVIKLSEAFGHLIGRNLDNPGITFDLEGIVKGMRDAAAGIDSPMTEQEYEEAIASIQENAFNELANSNLKEANAFMESNVKEGAVVELEAGKLQYQVLAQGEGHEVAADSVPTIRYTGTYIDGTLFGSSEDAGGPVTLPLEQTIPGFQKGLLGMKEGEKRRIYIHPDLGYGTAGHLPPNSLLVFDVEVVSATDLDDSFDDEPVADEGFEDGSEDQIAETQEGDEQAVAS